MALAEAVEELVPGWVERSVRRVAGDAGRALGPELVEATAEAARSAGRDLGAEVRALVAADIDDQRTTPLSILRAGARYPAAVLRAAGVPPVDRDATRGRLFPDDLYDLAPATFADVDPRLTEPGLRWGAAKALAHLRRRGPAAPGG